MRGRGVFAQPRPWLGSTLLVFGLVYLAVMLIRYVVRMSLYPAERWTGGSIPIFFHWVLASFVLVVGGYHWRNTRAAHAEQLRQRSPRFRRWRRAFQIIGTSVVVLLILAWVGYL